MVRVFGRRERAGGSIRQLPPPPIPLATPVNTKTTSTTSIITTPNTINTREETKRKTDSGMTSISNEPPTRELTRMQRAYMWIQCVYHVLFTSILQLSFAIYVFFFSTLLMAQLGKLVETCEDEPLIFDCGPYDCQTVPIRVYPTRTRPRSPYLFCPAVERRNWLFLPMFSSLLYMLIVPLTWLATCPSSTGLIYHLPQLIIAGLLCVSLLPISILIGLNLEDFLLFELVQWFIFGSLTFCVFWIQFWNFHSMRRVGYNYHINLFELQCLSKNRCLAAKQPDGLPNASSSHSSTSTTQISQSTVSLSADRKPLPPLFAAHQESERLKRGQPMRSNDESVTRGRAPQKSATNTDQPLTSSTRRRLGAPPIPINNQPQMSISRRSRSRPTIGGSSA